MERTGCHGNGVHVGLGELGGTLRPPRRAAYIKTNWRSVLRRRKREGKRAKKKARVEAREGTSEPERKRASPQVSKQVCGVGVGVSSADNE